MNKTLGIDVDAVVADFIPAYVPLVQEVTGKDLFPHRWRELVFPLTWDFDLDAGYTAAELQEVWKVIQADKTFWKRIKPVKGAVKSIRHLNWLTKRGVDVYFLTHRMGVNAKSQTESWLYGCGMDTPSVLLAAEKAPLVKVLGVTAFIDDKPDTLHSVADYAQAQNLPVKGHIYRLKMPYNRNLGRNDLVSVDSLAEMLNHEGL